MSLYRDNKYRIKLGGEYFDFFKEAESEKNAKQIISEQKRIDQEKRMGPYKYKLIKESDLFGNTKFIIWRKLVIG